MKLTTAQALILFGLLTEKVRILNSLGDVIHQKTMREEKTFYEGVYNDIIQSNRNSITETTD